MKIWKHCGLFGFLAIIAITFVFMACVDDNDPECKCSNKIHEGDCPPPCPEKGKNPPCGCTDPEPDPGCPCDPGTEHEYDKDCPAPCPGAGNAEYNCDCTIAAPPPVECECPEKAHLGMGEEKNCGADAGLCDCTEQIATLADTGIQFRKQPGITVAQMNTTVGIVGSIYSTHILSTRDKNKFAQKVTVIHVISGDSATVEGTTWKIGVGASIETITLSVAMDIILAQAQQSQGIRLAVGNTPRVPEFVASKGKRPEFAPIFELFWLM